MMQPIQFKDNTDSLWTLKINIRDYIQIKQDYGIDISDVFSKNNNWLAQLAAQDNLMDLIGIIVLLTKVEREAKGISEDDFLALFGGDTLEAATTAFIEAVVLFLPAHKQTAMRTVLNALDVGMKKTQETLEKSSARIVEKVEATMEAEAQKVLDELNQ
jgi:hypothetical protein